MNKTNPPTSFGVFKPVDHIVIAVATATKSTELTNALLACGFSGADLVHYTAGEMTAQARAHVQAASPLASLGQDLNLVKAQLALAERGCSFLVVHAPEAGQIERITDLATRLGVLSAQRYGSLIVEELITQPQDEQQTFESPDTGLNSSVANATRA